MTSTTTARPISTKTFMPTRMSRPAAALITLTSTPTAPVTFTMPKRAASPISPFLVPSLRSPPTARPVKSSVPVFAYPIGNRAERGDLCLGQPARVGPGLEDQPCTEGQFLRCLQGKRDTSDPFSTSPSFGCPRAGQFKRRPTLSR